jgi:hypothetical protein
MLKDERDCLDGLAKSMICGCIKNLSANLYTSSIHYVYEILQNFEDAQYKNKGIVQVYINESCIILANNEIGFTANDVNSICNLSNSEKKLNTHIGNKGIGFKSCFLCTKNPIIVSKPSWRFEFKIDENNMMSFITPLAFCSNESLPEILKKYMDDNDQLTTFMYFPFKEIYKKDYFERLLNNFDENILLFTKNIEKLVIDDKINHKILSFRREYFDDSKNSIDKMKIRRAKLYKNDEVYREFRIFQTSGDQRSDDIAFAFPLIRKENQNFSIYSIFPIYDLKLNFLISSYWILTTNRETINEYDHKNLSMRKRLLELFSDIITNDEFIIKNIFDYLPKLETQITLWWKSFFFDFERKFKTIIDKVYKNMRIWDENFEKLVERKDFELTGIKIIDKKNDNISEYFCKVSIFDLLKLLQLKNLNEYKNKWWEGFFKLLKLNIHPIDDKVLLNEIYNTCIFLIDSKRQALKNVEKSYLNDTNKDFYSICMNHEISLIDFSSDSEKIFLKDSLNLETINEKIIITSIIDDYLNEKFTKQVLINDMDFIKNNFSNFEHYIQDGICVPVIDKVFASIENATLSTLFSIDMTSGIPFVQNKEIYKFLDYPKKSLKQCLEYEVFYLKLKCLLPKVDVELMQEKINLKDNTLPILDIIKSIISDEEVSLANKIFDLLPKEYIEKIIYKLPVKLDNGGIRAISDLYLNDINLQQKNINLALKFGIKEFKKEEISNANTDPVSVIQPLIDTGKNPFNNEKNVVHKRPEYFHFFDHSTTNDIEGLFETYIQRINDQDVPRDRNEKVIMKSSIIFNFEERINTGCHAELYFYAFLQHIFKNTLLLENCWISSLRSRLFPNSSDNCDDSKGYDFEIIDSENLFSSDRKKRCLIEVKGFKNEWDDNFFMTKNEVNRKETTKNNNNELYIIVIIEFVGYPDRIRIAEVINLTQNNDLVELIEAESFKFKLNKNIDDDTYAIADDVLNKFRNIIENSKGSELFLILLNNLKYLENNLFGCEIKSIKLNIHFISLNLLFNYKNYSENLETENVHDDILQAYKKKKFIKTKENEKLYTCESKTTKK